MHSEPDIGAEERDPCVEGRRKSHCVGMYFALTEHHPPAEVLALFEQARQREPEAIGLCENFAVALLAHRITFLLTGTSGAALSLAPMIGTPTGTMSVGKLPLCSS